MPPKSSSNKKTPAASWYYCETCNVHITTKERETHDTVCPINVSSESNGENVLEYISNGVLYTGSVERRTFNIEELKDLPIKYVNNLLYMSEGAIRLTGLHIGQQVSIRSMTQTKLPALVRAIWPIPEKFLTTIYVSNEDYKIHWQPFKGDYVKIEALPPTGMAHAKNVHLILETVADIDLKALARHLKLKLKHLIYANDSRIYVDFFNKSLTLKIVDWSVYEQTEEPLTQAFERLSLDKKRKHEFVKVCATTTFHITSLQAEAATDTVESEPLTTKADIGGLTKQLELIENAMQYALGFKTLPKGVKISRALLLYGAAGCGKTMICEALCAQLQQQNATVKPEIVRINTSELFSKFLGETEKNLTACFERAYSHYPQPTLIVIEDVHHLSPKHETNEVIKRVAVAFAVMLDTLGQRREAQRTFLLATTSNIEALSANVRRCGRLDSEVEIGVPSPQARLEILQCLLRNVKHCLTMEDVHEVAQITHGYVGADLASLVYTASLESLKAGCAQLRVEEVQAALTRVKPSAMREVLIENPNVHWTDIGGQAELKLKLQQAIEWPLQHPEKFKRLGIKPPRGILMYGPPGCSKTMIAKALATESHLNFLSIKGPELFSMWVGESERAVREVFRKARQVAPAIVFFDEIDAIGGERSDGGAGGSGATVKERVLTQLLTELDGVEALENVTIVAATNRPDMIDKALLRPGRIDRIVYVGLPDDEAREEIFRIKLRSMPLAADVHVSELVARTAEYSGAEIQAVCHEAALKTLEESFEAEHVTWSHFEYALQLVRPRTSSELLSLYAEYGKQS